MAITRDLIELVEIDRDDVFSVSLDTDPAKPEHQTVQPAYAIRAKNGIRDILEGLPIRRRKTASQVAAPILAFIDTMRPEGRGLAIFAAPGLWRQQFFPFALPNRISYGRPDVMPVLWTVDEYEPYAILVIDSERARILVAYLGAAAVMEHDELVLDTSEWRFTAGRQPTYAKAVGTGAARGT